MAAALLLVMLQACGNKGPLYLPDTPPAGSEPVSAPVNFNR
jgi:predicted small lipoprotein YifL